MFEKIDENLEKKYEVTNFPLNVAIEMTNHCNLNCIMCGHDKQTRKKGYMSSELYRRIIDEVVIENPNTRIWLDFYGEPLLLGYKLYYFIDYAKKKGCTNVATNTNGTLMKKEYADMLLDSDIDYISIDCDGFSKEVYESIRVGADRDVFFDNITYLLEEKKRRNKKVIIDVKAIEMEKNKHEISQIMKYWSELGAWTAYRRMSDWVGHSMNEEDNEGRIACGHAIGTCAISWDGIIAGCAWDGDCETKCGNVNEESIASIWQRRNETIVKKHLNHCWSELSESCQHCTTWKNIGEMRYDEEGKNISRNYNTDEKLYS